MHGQYFIIEIKSHPGRLLLVCFLIDFQADFQFTINVIIIYQFLDLIIIK